MDIFIDQEINTSDENEAVLLEVDDLFTFKNPPPQRTTGKQKGRHGGHQGGKKDATKCVQDGDTQVTTPHRDRGDIMDDPHEWLIKKEQVTEDNYEDDLEDHLTHHEEEGDMLDADRADENTISGKNRSKYNPSCTYPLITYMYGRAKSYIRDMVHRVEDKLHGHVKRDDDFFYYKSHTSLDFIHVLANRLYYSRGTMYLYFLVIVLNLFILFYTAYTKMVSLFVVLCELFVILMLLLEVCLRLATQGRSYFHNLEGLFDVTVTTMCFLLLISSGDLKIFYHSEMVKTKNKEVEEIISQSLTVLRFSFQLFRTITLFMHYERVKAPSENIDFAVLNLPHEEEDDYVI
ncbi:hypothetical protein AK88_04196 [Plasmodium fragile]|uniref:Ion transport domain-containing protein n=1 Tax=Plasmodium fragile TaxID=5857 RepID=A0A0D9QGH2_PLAFR|nr:uncharacterized protein AK88_04196 [Plasmodium fragile]KJP86145.1 hypothetical protein AK88_04196 [Plasmodium fragile]